MKYKRVLLKLSGEALKGKVGINELNYMFDMLKGLFEKGEKDIVIKERFLKLMNGILDGMVPLDTRKLDYVTDEIIKLFNEGVEISVVIGGGNISRGTLGEKWNIPSVEADINGMWATMTNAGWISSVLDAKLEGDNVRNMVSLPSSYCAELYAFEKARSYLTEKKIVVIGGGNGISLCTTDSAAVQRAIEVKADCVIMLKNGVDGVYTDDPRKNSDAKLYETMSFTDLKNAGAKILDETAAIIAAKYKMPMHFVNFDRPDAIVDVCSGKKGIGTYVGEISTRLY